MRIGITGHQRLPDEAAWAWVRTSLLTLLESAESLTGLSSLAVGADQLFAEIVLALNGKLTVVIPFDDYETRFTEGREEFKSLLSRAADVVRLQRAQSDEESYYQAGRWIVDHSDWLMAVWNGLPSRGWGGTADVVAYAHKVGKHVVQIDPVHRLVNS